MKRRLLRSASMLLMLLALLTAGQGGKFAARADGDDGTLPCDPGPTRWCELRGGTFNYVTCMCEYPPN
ncbi:MAG TPA: hypothetical protein VF668_18735 [Pyrinomonadaceae bacterium]